MNGFNCFLNGLHIGDMGMTEQGKMAVLISAEIGKDGKVLGFHLTGSGYSIEKKEHREWFNVTTDDLNNFSLIFKSVDASKSQKTIILPKEYHPAESLESDDERDQ